jgi:hypothetical protein
MRNLLIALAVFMGSCPAEVWAQEDAPRPPRPFQEERRRDSDLDRGPFYRIERGDLSPDLWYGTPRVRAGGDLLVPLIDLIRRPSSLLDFRPRNVPRVLPDRETVEFLRERR